MVKILIDTCVWLDIAKSYKGEKTLLLLEELINQKEISLIIPEIIISEFERNKERIVSAAGKSLSSHFDKVKEMIEKYGDSESKNTVLSQLDNVNFKIPTLGESAIDSVQRIEDLFLNSEKIALTDEIKLRATQRAIDKRAPFHLSKNSIGDAIIIESFVDYKAKNESQEFKLKFVTHNKTDFSLKNGNQRIPHEDLAEIFDSPKSQYYINLFEALNSINPELINEIEIENEWEVESRSFRELLEVERELGRKIWYNRHQIRAQKIQKGEIRIINRKDFSLETMHNTIVKDIWQGAKKSAKAVEDEFGKENLYWDDFEWGMLNGKLSAIRWMIGEDWDNLDT